MTDTTHYLCDLCRLPVELQGFELATKDGPKRFCCDGCMGIYRMLHEENIIDADNPPGGG
jgi:hypothetical protein